MCRSLKIALVVTGLLLGLLASQSTAVVNTRIATSPGNTAVVYGLHVALPSNMKNFPPERVPLP